MPEFEMCAASPICLVDSPSPDPACSLEDDDEEGADSGAYRVEEVLRVLEPEEVEEIDVKKSKADIAFLEGVRCAPSCTGPH